MTQRTHDGDFAQQMRWLVDEANSEVEVVRVVLDNLNTHNAWRRCTRRSDRSAEARRIAKRLEFHYTLQARKLVESLAGNRVHPYCTPFLPQTAAPRIAGLGLRS